MPDPETIAVIAAVSSMVDAVNQGAFDKAVAAFSPSPTIVEDIAPYCWQGPGAASAWLAAMGSNAAALGVTAITMDLGPPDRIDVNQSAAYGVFPGSLRLSGASDELCAIGVLTLTLNKSNERWLIETLAWSGPPPAAA
jgi:hypothetical protein